MKHEHAIRATDILCRRTRLAFLNSTASRLTVPRVVEIMGNELGWDAQRRRMEVEITEKLLNADFGGTLPNKQGAQLRAACTADVKEIFDQIDVEKSGTISVEGIAVAAEKLGFPLHPQQLRP